MARILLIDDDNRFRYTAAKMLVAGGHEVIEAESGMCALRILAEGPPLDLAITDIVMPDMEGIETIARLLAASPQLKIIAMSGSGIHGPTFLDIARKFGAAATIEKPFRSEALRGLISRVLQGQSTPQKT